MILFIWVSIHKPHVYIEILVNNSFIFNGIYILDRLSKDVVISSILRIRVFKCILFILDIGRVLKNIIVPKIVIRLLILFFILVDINKDVFCLLLGIYFMFLGLIR